MRNFSSRPFDRNALVDNHCKIECSSCMFCKVLLNVCGTRNVDQLRLKLPNNDFSTEIH